jgi:hypothetical protein
VKRAATLYVFLTLLVRDLFAFDQGLFHDDAYRPHALIRPEPLPARAHALLEGPSLLGRLLPGAGAPDAMLAP